MSKKFRNIIRPAFMRNFTRYTIDRYILIDIETLSDNEKDKFVSDINEQLWYIIQKINELSQYNLPYVNLRRVENFDGEKLRIIIEPNDTDNDNQEYVIEDESHVILMTQLSPQRIIQLGYMQGNGRANILADEHSQMAATIDILLDISMFNSISYLKELDNTTKRDDINEMKFRYFIEKGLESYFYINPSDLPNYISLAFSQHISHNKFNYDGYISCWDQFLNEYFPNKKCTNISPVEQLKTHVDYKNIDDLYKTEKYWQQKAPGVYCLLRVNKRPNDESRENRILNYFGKPEYHIGLTKVIPFSEYHMPYLKKDLQELNISAFKIVVD